MIGGRESWERGNRKAGSTMAVSKCEERSGRRQTDMLQAGWEIQLPVSCYRHHSVQYLTEQGE